MWFLDCCLFVLSLKEQPRVSVQHQQKKSINVAPAGKLAPSSKLCLGLMVNFQIVVLMAPVDYDVLKSFNPKSVANEQFKKNSNLRFLK